MYSLMSSSGASKSAAMNLIMPLPRPGGGRRGAVLTDSILLKRTPRRTRPLADDPAFGGRPGGTTPAYVRPLAQSRSLFYHVPFIGLSIIC